MSAAPRWPARGFGPQPVVLAREADVAVVDLLAHRHGEGHAQAADEILLLVAVEDDGVDHPHGSIPP